MRKHIPVYAIACVTLVGVLAIARLAIAQELAKKRADDNTYLPVVINKPFDEIYKADTSQREKVLETQQQLLETRYDLRNQAAPMKMSGGRKAVQQGVRVKLPEGQSWESLASISSTPPRETCGRRPGISEESD
jgi:cytochrome c peroxidase